MNKIRLIYLLVFSVLQLQFQLVSFISKLLINDKLAFQDAIGQNEQGKIKLIVTTFNFYQKKKVRKSHLTFYYSHRFRKFA